MVEHRSKRQTDLMNSAIRALASTSRIKPLFPDRLAHLALDEYWAELAGSVVALQSMHQRVELLAAPDGGRPVVCPFKSHCSVG